MALDRTDHDAPTHEHPCLLRLVGGVEGAAADVLALARTSDDPALLVAAALLAHDRSGLPRAAAQATTSRDRQLVALADLHLAGEAARYDALVREHLAEHPDHLLASWMAGQTLSTDPSKEQQ